ncbi:MAG: molecular chaperone TorD family protein [Hyphomicrobiaceae bacterium]|nr:molecular chaperone TorD family protein [Hyphomicrobiaceae bacterium]
MIAHFLSGPPGEDAIAVVRELAGEPGTALGEAISAWSASAKSTTPAELAEAYQTLFIGLGRGILVPYGSYYLTGFLHEKPLARLRQDMAALGIVRSSGVSEPEDHIASELEIMAGLIDGTYGGPQSLALQQQFFDAHVGAWAGHFFRDLAKTEPSPFYAALGETGQVFMELEERAFGYG